MLHRASLRCLPYTLHAPCAARCTLRRAPLDLRLELADALAQPRRIRLRTRLSVPLSWSRKHAAPPRA
jgi:hypothetical protein